MEKFNKHADIPYNSKVYINACENTTDLCLVVPELGAIEFPFDYTPGKVDDTVKFIVEACNNYYRLKEHNEKLLSALEKIQNPVLYLQKQAQSQGASFDGLMAVALSKDCEWLKSIAYEAIKSCQP
jgi:hypothetical protein